MSFLWGAIIGTATPIPYFYCVFFIATLIHRCGRDFERYGLLRRFSRLSLNSVYQVFQEVRKGLGQVLLHRQV